MCKGNLDSCTQMLLDHSGAQGTSQERECMEVCGTLVQYISNINGMIDAAIQSSKGYTLLQELACNITSYCTSGCGIFTRLWLMKIQPIPAICTLLSIIKFLLSITTTVLYLFLHKVPSRSPVLIKAYRGC